MNEQNLFTTLKITKVAAATGAGSSPVTSVGVDMTGYDGVMFITTFGTGHASHAMKAVQGTASGSASLTSDITCNLLTGPGSTTGSAQDAWSKAYSATAVTTTTGSEPVIVVDVKRPYKQYVGVTVTPATSTTIGEIYALRYRASKEPVINNDGSTVMGVVAQALS